MRPVLRKPMIHALALLASGCAVPPPRVPVEQAAQQAAAVRRQSDTAAQAHVAALAQALQAQARDEAWAPAREKQLRESLSGVAPALRLQHIECRRSMCELRLAMPPSTESLAALAQWVAWGQPCAYTQTHEAIASADTIGTRVFLACTR